jgi:hypothetical protein
VSERKPFLLRLPQDLHDDLRAWAEQDLRSLNGQIEFLLREAVRRRRGTAGGGASSSSASAPPPPRRGRPG